jgi:hypothetical protein
MNGRKKIIKTDADNLFILYNFKSYLSIKSKIINYQGILNPDLTNMFWGKLNDFLENIPD